VRKAEEKQQERLATSMFGTKEERATKLMGMARCLQKMGEKEKERAESNSKLPSNNGTGNAEEDEVGGDRMGIEYVSPIKREEYCGEMMDEGHEDRTQGQIPNKTLAERGKEVMKHMDKKMKASVKGKASKSVGGEC